MIRRSLPVWILLAAGLGWVAYMIFAGQRTVDDQADIFSEENVDYIASYHAMLLDQYDIDYRVITSNGDEDLNYYANRQFTSRRVGEESEIGRGLLLVINTAQDQVRLETSANLESVFTDAFVSYIERNQMVPFFKANRVADGILATGELIRIRAEDAKNGREFDPSKMLGSIGAGAKTDAQIGEAEALPSALDYPDIAAADSPEETLRRYFAGLKKYNMRRDLDVLTENSRAHMAKMVMTVGQMDNVVKRYKKCEVERVVYNDDASLAVLLHALSDRECDPFAFEKGDDGKWRLDLKAIGMGLGHTYGNIWYVHGERQLESGLWKYAFGFRDYYFYRPKGEQFDHQRIPYYLTGGLRINHVYTGSHVVELHGDDSYLAEAGLRVGDLITSWEWVEYPHQHYISNRMKSVRAGSDVEIEYRRGDQILRTIVKAPPKPRFGGLRWGASYRSVGPARPLVHYVSPDSFADALGLQVGDKILEWNGFQHPAPAMFIHR